MIINWLIIFSLLNIGSFALGSFLFPKFNDKGFSVSKILNLAMFSYLLWLPGFIFSGFYNNQTIFTLFLIWTFLLAFLFRKNITISRHEWKDIIIQELLFIILFISMLLFRGANPRIEGIEKFMDFAILNGLNRAQSFPIQDVWFSGNNINYYYFGHWVLTVLSKITNIQLVINYNFLVAFIFAQTGTTIFSLVYNLTKKHILSLLSTILLVLAGNLDYLYNVIILQSKSYFYAQARSLIPFTINEFPLYSFLISDLHAHIIDILFVLSYFTVVAYLFSAQEHLKRYHYVLLAFTLGLMGAVNTWDMVFCALFTIVLYFGVAINARNVEPREILLRVLRSIEVILVAYLFFLPFYMYFQPAVFGVTIFLPKFDISAIAKMFGLFLVVVIPYIVIKLKYLRNNLMSLPFLITIFSILLIALPSFFVIKDIYSQLNVDYTHANTYFKVWYLAWIMLSISTPLIIKEMWNKNKKIALLFIVPFCFLLITCIAYTVTSVRYITGKKYNYISLNGSDYLENGFNDERILIDYINTNIVGQPIILESYGDSYTMDSLISSYTGLPTLVGWSNHQLGWRNNWPEISSRMGDIRALYTSNNISEVEQLVAKYNIQYIVISRNEVDEFGEFAGATARGIYQTVFEQNNVRLLKVN